jgi:hypothetical protein
MAKMGTVMQDAPKGGPRRRGRPPLDPNDPSVSVTVRFPGAQYDELYAQARAARTSIPRVIRAAVRERQRRRQ